MSNLEANAVALGKEYQWFNEVIEARFTRYFQPAADAPDVQDLVPPDHAEGAGPYVDYLKGLADKIPLSNDGPVSHTEQVTAHRLLLLLALAPHLQPATLDVFFTKNTNFDRGFTEFGGLTGKQHGGFLPTGETALFLLAGGDLRRRMFFTGLFEESHFLYTENVLQLSGQKADEPFLSGQLTISNEYLTRFTTGDEFRPRYSSTFPAKHLQTPLEWDDLVLEAPLKAQVLELSSWMSSEAIVLGEWQMARLFKPGYRALFHGPPGTGKTLCASLIGKKVSRPVYRIDLSQVVSKYIGETEKNLANLFNIAEHKNWILFFDEADALFGKRTATKDAHDRYANQEVSYLLQRIEDFPSLVILATNLKANIDDAFARRFQSILYFPVPGPLQRLELWENAFGDNLPLEAEVDLKQLAREYEISGGDIVNVVRYCALKAAQRVREEHEKREEEPPPRVIEAIRKIRKRDILEGIRRELRKRGKTV